MLQILIWNAADIDNDVGNFGCDGVDEIPFISLERGIATHVYAAFEPSLKGMCHYTAFYTNEERKRKGEVKEIKRKKLLTHALGNNGAYLLESRLADPYSDTVKPWATSKVEAERLWKLSEKLVGQEFAY